MHSVHAHKANEMCYGAIIFQGSYQIFFKNIRFDYFHLVTDLVYCNIGCKFWSYDSNSKVQIDNALEANRLSDETCI